MLLAYHGVPNHSNHLSSPVGTQQSSMGIVIIRSVFFRCRNTIRTKRKMSFGSRSARAWNCCIRIIRRLAKNFEAG